MHRYNEGGRMRSRIYAPWARGTSRVRSTDTKCKTVVDGDRPHAKHRVGFRRISSSQLYLVRSGYTYGESRCEKQTRGETRREDNNYTFDFLIKKESQIYNCIYCRIKFDDVRCRILIRRYRDL